MDALLRLLGAVPEPLFWPTLVVLLLAFVAGLWCIVTLMTALVGWRDLARSYATAAAPHGQPFSSLTGSVGLASYRGLNAWAAPEGLFLSAPWLFRLGHKPLLIPWDDIRDIEVSKVVWADVASFTIAGTTLKLPARVLTGRPAFMAPAAAAPSP